MYYNVLQSNTRVYIMSTKSESLSLRLPLKTRQKLEQLAQSTGRSKSVLAVEALDQYLESEAWQIEAIKQGIASADAGELIDIDEVEAKWMNK